MSILNETAFITGARHCVAGLEPVTNQDEYLEGYARAIGSDDILSESFGTCVVKPISNRRIHYIGRFLLEIFKP